MSATETAIKVLDEMLKLSDEELRKKLDEIAEPSELAEFLASNHIELKKFYGVSQMSWQNCPSCGGTGIDCVSAVSTGIQPCPVCKGKRIIHTVTGKPPEK